MTFVAVEPRKLSSDEKQELLDALIGIPTDERVDRFIEEFETILGRYPFWKRRSVSRISDAELRSIVSRLKDEAVQLKQTWEALPEEVWGRLDLALQKRMIEAGHSTYDPSIVVTSAESTMLSAVSSPWFELLDNHLDVFVDLTIEIDEQVSSSKGGRPLNAPLIFLARAIGNAFREILLVSPVSTDGGAFSNVVHFAFKLVRDSDAPEDCSRYVKRTIRDLREKAPLTLGTKRRKPNRRFRP